MVTSSENFEIGFTHNTRVAFHKIRKKNKGEGKTLLKGSAGYGKVVR